MEIITGGIPAEYGEKANGVINLSTRSGLGTGGIKGDVTIGGAEFQTGYGSIAAGGGDSRLGWFASADGSRSDRFLDPVSFDNFHNEGNTVRGFLRLDSVSGDGTSNWRFTGNIGRTERDVTNLPSQEEAGQDQNVVSNDWNLNLGYQKILGDGLVLEGQVYARDNRLTLYSSPNDTPVQADQNRSLENQGINLALSKTLGAHELKVGVQAKRFPIQERFSFGITDPAFNDPDVGRLQPEPRAVRPDAGGSPFDFSASKTGTYVAAYVQDNIRWNDLTVNVGLRYDHNDLFRTENQLQPRIGDRLLPEGDEHGLPRLVQPHVHHARVREHPALVVGRRRGRSLRPRSRTRRSSAAAHSSTSPSGTTSTTSASSRDRQRSSGSTSPTGIAASTNAADQDQFFNTGIVFPLNFESGTSFGLERAARPRARSRRPARLRVRRPRGARILQPRSWAVSSSTPGRSTRSPAAASSSTTTRTSRSRLGSSTTSARRASGRA